MARKVIDARRASVMTEHWTECHTPKCMDGTCDDCLAAAATRAAAEKNDQQVRGTERGHVLGVDFTGPHPVTVDGNVWHLGVTDAATGVKFSHA